MDNACNARALEATISQWPGVRQDQTSTYNIYFVEGRKFCWIPKTGTMIQIAPPLGRDEKTRRLERAGPLVKVVRNQTGEVEAQYLDPGQRLEPLWSHPAFRPSRTPQDEAESLVRQAYEQAQGKGGDPTPSSNKVIQVPMEEALIQALDSLSQKLGRSRADIIREACRRYLRRAEREELDRIYREGYDHVPEEPIMALTQAALLSQVLPKEEW